MDGALVDVLTILIVTTALGLALTGVMLMEELLKADQRVALKSEWNGTY